MPIILIVVGTLAAVAFFASASGSASAVPVIDAKKAAIRRVALLLLQYVQSGKRDKNKIATGQRAIGAKATGIPDSQTHAKIEKLLGFGVDWPGLAAAEKAKRNIKPPSAPKDPLYALLGPGKEIKFLQAAKPAPRPAPKPAPRPAPKPAPRPAPKPAPRPAPKPAPRPAPKPAPSPGAALFRWAKVLDQYVAKGGRDRVKIAAYQRNIGRLDPDGYPLEQTRNRLAAILQRQLTWKPIPTSAFAGPATSPTDPKAAALELWDYVHVYGGSRKERVIPYQQAMQVTPAIGNIGPITKARVKALTGKDL